MARMLEFRSKRPDPATTEIQSGTKQNCFAEEPQRNSLPKDSVYNCLDMACIRPAEYIWVLGPIYRRCCRNAYCNLKAKEEVSQVYGERTANEIRVT